MATFHQKILIVDDDPQVRRVLSVALSVNDYAIHQAATGRDAIAAIEEQKPDLVLLDLDLPDVTGLEVLKHIRRSFNNPVMIISAHNNTEEIVAALQQGADDFITKPFRTNRILSSVSLLLDRSVSKHTSIVDTAGLKIDLDNHTVVKNGDQKVNLTPDEQKLLELLSLHNGRIFTELHLVRYLSVVTSDKSLFIKKLINGLRLKIEPNTDRPRFIVTEPGVGYRFVG